jgi:D-methionine transport system substrate-binding protein
MRLAGGRTRHGGRQAAGAAPDTARSIMSRKTLLSAAALALPLALVRALRVRFVRPRLDGCRAEGPGSDRRREFRRPVLGDFPSCRPRRTSRSSYVNFSEYTQPTRRCRRRAGPQPVPARDLSSRPTTSGDDDLQPIGSPRSTRWPVHRRSTSRSRTSPRARRSPCRTTIATRPAACWCCSLAGLIELENGGSIFSTSPTSTKRTPKVKVEALDAAFTATSLPDVGGAIVNNDFLEDAGLTAEDANAQETRPTRTRAVHQHHRRQARTPRTRPTQARRESSRTRRRSWTAWSRRPAAPP